MTPTADQALVEFCREAAERAEGPLVVGLCGAQGSGKSTAAGAAAQRLTAEGLSCAVLALDDLYLTKAERRALAADVHPLLATRGPPGAHDVGLAQAILADLRAGRPTRVPCFDKLLDDRAEAWTAIEAPPRVVIFEGWCIGARPQPAAALAQPVNALEVEEDTAAVWRIYVNDRLASDYAQLFASLDRLVFLQAPGFGVVRDWRAEQEAHTVGLAGGTTSGMAGAAMDRFVSHYERLTRWMLDDLPAHADLVIDLDASRRVTAVARRGSEGTA